MILDWDIEVAIEPSVISMMQIAADRCSEIEGIQEKSFVSLHLCDDETIRKYNATYRNTDRATDVLSFPTVCYPAGITAEKAEKLLRNEYDDEKDACFLGDIIISVPHLLAQADEYGHTPYREAAYLLVHGLFHLFGYDHMTEQEKKIMRNQEEKVLTSIGIDMEDNCRISDNALLELAKEAMKRSYSPYSSYPVGAALHCTDGRVFQGCNIENASFGLTNCAERTAVFKAISEGAYNFDVIAIASEKSAPWPCGACRQVLNEFSPQIRVIVTWGDHETDEMPLNELLPHGFGPNELH